MTTRRQTKRASTGDRGPPGSGLVEIHTVEQIGPRMSKLPNGSLLCKDVPIARTGTMLYGPGETPVKTGSNGIAYVERTADELFNPVTIGSCMGAAVVDEHPADDVTPNNWKELALGFATTNVRQGTGDDADVILADLIVTDKALIESVMAGKREVSLGYDADYEQTAPGLGLQTNIVVNHIALVEKGRCGPRCAIGDRAHQPSGRTTMKTQRVILKRTPTGVSPARQRVLDAEAELAEAQAEATNDEEAGIMDEGATHIHIHTGPGEPTTDKKGKGKDEGGEIEKKDGAEANPLEARVAALEGGMSGIVDSIKGLTAAVRAKSGQGADGEPDDEKDDKTKDGEQEEDPDKAKAKDAEGEEDPDKKETKDKTKDSAALATSYADTLAKAEILVPGFRMPTFDAALPRAKTIDNMCAMRRRALDACTATTEGLELVTSVNGGEAPDLSKVDCVGVATLFKAAAGAKALMNNRSTTGDGKTAIVKEGDSVYGKIPTPAEINAASTKFWAEQAQAQQH